MYADTIDTIAITPTTRLRVVTDEDSMNPRVNNDGVITGVITVERNRDTITVEAVHADCPDLQDAHSRLMSYRSTVGMHRGSVGSAPRLVNGRDTFPRPNAYPVFDPRLVTRWARIFHDMTVVWDEAHGAYWFVSPEGIETTGAPVHTVEEQLAAIEAEQAEYAAWANNEATIVILEREETWANVADSSQTRKEWAEVASLGSNYLTDDYTAKNVAREYFPLTEDEDAALAA